jgi:NADPH2:quinone reductase
MNLKEALLHQTKILEECAKLFDENKLKIHLSQTFPLEKAASAHEAIATGSTTGKIALLID